MKISTWLKCLFNNHEWHRGRKRPTHGIFGKTFATNYKCGKCGKDLGWYVTETVNLKRVFTR